MRRVFTEKNFFMKKIAFVLGSLKSYVLIIKMKIDLPKRIQYHSEKHKFS